MVASTALANIGGIGRRRVYARAMFWGRKRAQCRVVRYFRRCESLNAGAVSARPSPRHYRQAFLILNAQPAGYRNAIGCAVVRDSPIPVLAEVQFFVSVETLPVPLAGRVFLCSFKIVAGGLRCYRLRGCARLAVRVSPFPVRAELDVFSHSGPSSFRLLWRVFFFSRVTQSQSW